ncbi:S1 family peptidase [Kitasatospora sp. NPDC058965]|uniref:S1 family peptidase n=1 Tax=Kitasatospora sp. NPDC058965 TaxID=3346682 RepID=UPI0036C6C3D0
MRTPLPHTPFLPKALGALTAATALALAVPATGAAAAPAGHPLPHIVGGGTASQTYSFMISLQQDGSHVCGASLISPTWAVTAAHCVSGATPDQFTVRVGSTDRTGGGEVTGLSRIVVHPNYSTNNDIALLQLSSPVQAAPIRIADSAPVGTATRLLGWGQETPQPGGDGGPDQLKELDTSLVADGCAEGFDAGSELCVNNPQGPDGSNQGACYGDSGGPAIARVNGDWQLIGATSRSGGDATCAVNPSIYTNVTAFADFVRTTTAG